MCAADELCTPDVRDGLDFRQRLILRTLVVDEAMASATPASSKVIMERIAATGECSPNDLYSRLVNMMQDWKARYPLVSTLGHCGSIAGLPPPEPEQNKPFLSDFAIAVLNDKVDPTSGPRLQSGGS